MPLPTPPPGGHIHPGDPATPHGGAPGHSRRAPLPALPRDCHPRWEDRDVPVSGPGENSASRLPGASQGGSSPPPRLPDTRAACRPPTGERPARQLLVPFTRAGRLCCRCHRIRGTLGRVRLALRQPLRSVAGCRPLGDWVTGSPPASPASPFCKSPAPRPPGPPRSSRPSEWRRRRDLCKGFRQRQGRGPEAVSKPTGMGREEDQQRQVEVLLFSFEKPNDGKICF